MRGVYNFDEYAKKCIILSRCRWYAVLFLPPSNTIDFNYLERKYFMEDGKSGMNFIALVYFCIFSEEAVNLIECSLF